MKVTILNTFSNTGGAANAAYRLHLALRRCYRKEVNSNYLVRTKGRCKDDKTRVIQESRIEKLKRYIDALFQKYYVNKHRTEISTTLFSTSFYGVDVTRSHFIQQADLINLHWTEKYISLDSLEKLVSLNKPLVWTLHDERPYTGGCHYTAGCDGYLSNCSECKQLTQDPLNLPSKYLEKKKEILKNADLTVVATSQWHYKRIQQSALFKHARIEYIPNSLDVAKYAPKPKQKAKQILGIDEDVITLQFGAHNVKDIRKGYIYLLEALKICLKNESFKSLCDAKKVMILRLGKVGSGDDNLPIEAKKLGLIKDNDQLINIYNATDIFILPSLEDNLPYTMIESMSCGTPVIGFASGGIPDTIDSDCGILVPPKNSQELARSIIDLVMDSDKRTKMGIKSRKKITDNYTFEIQSRKYVELYSSILEKKRAEA